MNLHLLRQIHADMFYPQDWFRDQPFMQRAPACELTLPDGFEATSWLRVEQDDPDELPSAVELALLYVTHPELGVWERFLWTRDTDTIGQRIYVGGVDQGRTRGFQIHRHLRITDNWGVATWG